MNKKDFMKVLDFASFILIILATLLVVIFEFVGEYVVMKIAIIIYFVGLLVLTTFFALRTFAVFHNNGVEEFGDAEVSNEFKKRRKASIIIKLVLSLITFVFSFVVMIIF